MWGHSKKRVICSPGREGSGETKPNTWSWTSDLKNCGKNEFLLLKSPSLWYILLQKPEQTHMTPLTELDSLACLACYKSLFVAYTTVEITCFIPAFSHWIVGIRKEDGSYSLLLPFPGSSNTQYIISTQEMNV